MKTNALVHVSSDELKGRAKPQEASRPTLPRERPDPLARLWFRRPDEQLEADTPCDDSDPGWF